MIMNRKSPYSVLGVSALSTSEEVKKRFRELSRVYHPDNAETGNAEKFMEVNKAWEELQSYGFSEGGERYTHCSLFNIKITNGGMKK